MNTRNRQSQEPAPPEKLRAALLRLHEKRIPVPAKVDEALLRSARAHWAPMQAPASGLCGSAADSVPKPDRQDTNSTTSTSAERFVAGIREFVARWRWAAWGAIAASLVLLGALLEFGGDWRQAARCEDLNGDGVVDMLDAFALARELQQGPVTQPQLDLNGDGVVDERDVRALAARAVRLEQGGRS